MQYMGMSVSGTDRQHVVFNFSSATTLSMAGISVQGSVLAPRADVIFNNGNLEGTLVGRSLTGNGEFHNYTTLAQISAASPLPPAGAPDVTVTKTADQATINAGQTAGFTVTLKNTGTTTATGVTLSRSAAPGLGKDVVWAIDSRTGSPGQLCNQQGRSRSQRPASSSGRRRQPDRPHHRRDHLRRREQHFHRHAAEHGHGRAPPMKRPACRTSTRRPPSPSWLLTVTVTKTADQATINAGQTAGFTVTLKNTRDDDRDRRHA